MNSMKETKPAARERPISLVKSFPKTRRASCVGYWRQATRPAERPALIDSTSCATFADLLLSHRPRRSPNPSHTHFSRHRHLPRIVARWVTTGNRHRLQRTRKPGRNSSGLANAPTVANPGSPTPTPGSPPNAHHAPLGGLTNSYVGGNRDARVVGTRARRLDGGGRSSRARKTQSRNRLLRPTAIVSLASVRKSTRPTQTRKAAQNRQVSCSGLRKHRQSPTCRRLLPMALAADG